MNIIIATRMVAGLPKSILFVVPDNVTSDDVRPRLYPDGKGWSLFTVTGDCIEVVADSKAVAKLLKENAS